MGAHTGCNTVYGSTPPSNPHPYPWMNSLFQDGATISWLIGESALLNHARRSVTPERLATALLEREVNLNSECEYFELTHLDDSLMTDEEIRDSVKRISRDINEDFKGCFLNIVYRIIKAVSLTAAFQIINPNNILLTKSAKLYTQFKVFISTVSIISPNTYPSG